MKRFVAVLAFLGAFVMLVGEPSAFAAPAYHETYVSGWEKYEFITNVCDEQAAFTTYFLTVLTITTDATGGVHYSEQIRFRTFGQGLETGAIYIDAGGAYNGTNVTALGANEFTFIVNENTVSLDPDVADGQIKIVVHQTLDANGNLTANIESVEFICK